MNTLNRSKNKARSLTLLTSDSTFNVHEFLNQFFNYIFIDCCNCIEKECLISNTQTFAPTFFKNFIQTPIKKEALQKQQECSVINSSTQIYSKYFKTLDKPSLVDSLINSFKLMGLIYQSDNSFRYYLLNNERFSWKNIKQLDESNILQFSISFPEIYAKIYTFFDNETEREYWTLSNFTLFVKSLLWYFRKGIVDTICSFILANTNVSGISVGSTNIDSDYDITLYGSNENIFKTIYTFNNKILQLFKVPANIVFDTNMYGVSFIKEGKDYRCGTNNFSVVGLNKITKEASITQNIWALIKVASCMYSIQEGDEMLYDLLKKTISYTRSENFKIAFKAAENFVNKFESNPNNYDKIVKNMDNLDYGNELNSDFYLTNYISFVNYNGIETYLTRGAFLDVVVNGQMCSTANANSKVQLILPEYFDSFIENITDLMIHYNKDKYLNRAITVLAKIELLLPSNILKNVRAILNDIKNIQSECKIKLVNCFKFQLMKNCVECIRIVSEVYFDEISTDTIKSGRELFIDMSSDFYMSENESNESSSSSLTNLQSKLSPVKSTFNIHNISNSSSNESNNDSDESDESEIVPRSSSSGKSNGSSLDSIGNISLGSIGSVKSSYDNINTMDNLRNTFKKNERKINFENIRSRSAWDDDTPTVKKSNLR